jgi:hypothetical protein
MRCVLRAAGMIFDVDEFLRTSELQAGGVYHSGESKGPGSASLRFAGSGFNVMVVDAAFDDLAGQFPEVVRFLDFHETELRRLGSFPGVGAVCLEFTFALRDAPIQSETFPADLLWRAGALDIDLVVTHYAIAAAKMSERNVL